MVLTSLGKGKLGDDKRPEVMPLKLSLMLLLPKLRELNRFLRRLLTMFELMCIEVGGRGVCLIRGPVRICIIKGIKYIMIVKY